MFKRIPVIVTAIVLALGVAAAWAVGAGAAATGSGADRESETSEFVGLAKDAGVALAEEHGREWRIASEDGEDFALDASLVVGRVTFDIAEGVIVAAQIESDAPSTQTSAPEPFDPDRAAVMVAGLRELVFVDNMFGGGPVFDDILVATVIGGDPDLALHPLEREMIAAALEGPAGVTFVADAQAETKRLFEASTEASAVSPGLPAVVSIGDVRIAGGRAELDLSLWCGSVCGVFLTYEVVATDGGWEVTGTVGPIAVS